METHQVMLNVLGYREDGGYAALALEMDLRGYGASFEEAVEDLDEQVKMQLSFALYKHNSLDMAYYPAEAVWFERFAEARYAALRSLTPDNRTEFQAREIPIPDPHIIKSMGEQFVPQNG